ncbi:hypothetical protein ACQUQU_12560 [Thalassolituus sp. LLYu03]|uniref:hypothetical protein n=1 Tax=Thalassolituus sp. LLYu03 TaxID=3421656 RepID=UPI003D2B3340
MGYIAVVLGRGEDRQLESLLGEKCQLAFADTISAAAELSGTQEAKLVMIDAVATGGDQAIDACRALKEGSDVPVVLLADEDSLQMKMQAYDAGCDDYLTRDDMIELKARIDRVLFNKIANDQLRMQLKQANEMAFIAMSDTSDLGVNIQFLLDVNRCDNLDELGMRLFQSIRSYGLNCSLQMRSRYGTKNMEANGMAKEMESAMLEACSEQGRYVDFGRRSIMNYERVSLLVKNMPVDDPKKYGAIKDNVFSLLQGCDARIVALDNLKSLELESVLVKRLSGHLSSVMATVDHSYQDVMRSIADVVENMADGVESSLQFLGMDERQESAMQKIMETGILETNRIFNDGMRLDKGLKEFLRKLDEVFASGHADPQQIRMLLDSMPGD